MNSFDIFLPQTFGTGKLKKMVGEFSRREC